MINVYRLVKLYRRIKSPRLKLLGILGMHVLGRRYLYVVMDPSLACNLRCRMCYFSNPEKVKTMKGTFTESDVEAIARSVFHRVLKLQIGCGAEPTTYRRLPELVRTAKESGIPNVSVTTNGNLLTKEKLEALVESGLDEVILSAHGLSREVYERMMTGASFDRFTALTDALASVKERFPAFHVRVNYTMCTDNVDDLKLLPQFFSRLKPDVIQLRPVQDIGSAVYSDYSMEALVSRYKVCIATVVDFCQASGIVCLYPQMENLNVISTENSAHEHLSDAVDLLPYFHLSPYEGWQKEFDPHTETFEDFARRTHRVRSMVRMLLGLGKAGAEVQDSVTHALNYSVG